MNWPDSTLGECPSRRCGRTVVWAVSQWGVLHPVDPEPAAGGIAILTVDDAVDAVHSKIETKFDPPGDRWELHHWTCGDRGRWLRLQSIRPGELRW